jgi:hypothetical protein
MEEVGNTNLVNRMWSRTHSHGLCLTNIVLRQAVAAMQHELILTPEQYEQCGQCNNSTVGHHGVEHTVKKMKAAGYTWPHLREHVRNFIRYCP